MSKCPPLRLCQPSSELEESPAAASRVAFLIEASPKTWAAVLKTELNTNAYNLGNSINLLEHGGRHRSGPSGGGLGEAAEVGASLGLLLLVDEVAARSVGAVAVDPVLLAVLGLVFVVSNNIFLKLKKGCYTLKGL